MIDISTLSQSEKAWTLLNYAVGNYFGTGINYEKQKFEAHCMISIEIPEKLLGVKFQAKGMKGEIYHDEISWIGRDVTGSLILYVNSTNHKGITPHYLNRIEESARSPRKIVFRYGEPEDKLSFREEITFAVHTNYNIEHSYAWGLPGGRFETRSTSILKKIN